MDTLDLITGEVEKPKSLAELNKLPLKVDCVHDWLIRDVEGEKVAVCDAPWEDVNAANAKLIVDSVNKVKRLEEALEYTLSVLLSLNVKGANGSIQGAIEDIQNVLK